MKNARPDLLSRPLFIFGVALLLLNDFYLKYEYGNFLTGKISDFAGLFVFPYFLSSIQIKRQKAIYFTTFLLFIFWKSTFSQEIIEWFQAVGIGTNRVVDYSDLVALIVLPFSYQYFQVQLAKEFKVSKALIIPLFIISMFAFWATTLQREKVVVNVDTNKRFELPMSKSELFNSLTTGHGNSDTLEENLQDSTFYLTFDMNDYRAQVTVLSIIKEIDSSKTIVLLDSVLYGYITGGLFSGVDKEEIDDFKSLTDQEFENHFENKVIIPIKENKAEYIYYDNKGNYDWYQEK